MCDEPASRTCYRFLKPERPGMLDQQQHGTCVRRKIANNGLHVVLTQPELVISARDRPNRPCVVGHHGVAGSQADEQAENMSTVRLLMCGKPEVLERSNRAIRPLGDRKHVDDPEEATAIEAIELPPDQIAVAFRHAEANSPELYGSE